MQTPMPLPMPTDLPVDPAVLNRMSRRFRQFAEQDGQDDPLYAVLARCMADDPRLCGLLAAAPSGQQLPVLLLAAIHDCVLDAELPPSALHAYYPTAGGTRLPDESLPEALLAFVHAHRDRLLHTVRTRSTQTNEVGRCGVLRVALQALMQRLDLGAQAPQPVALFDFGCSAGLNLSVQDYGYDDGWDLRPAVDPAAPTIRGTWRRSPPPGLRGPDRWRVTETLGVDLSPVEVSDERATRWLRACVWPHDAHRGERLGQALEWARHRPRRLISSQEGLQVLTDWVAILPGPVLPVMINTWVLAYLDEEQRRSLTHRVTALIRERGLAWISAEAGKFAPVPVLPQGSGQEPPETTTLWTLHWRARQGECGTPLAWSHAHGQWMDWVTEEDDNI